MNTSRAFALVVSAVLLSAGCTSDVEQPADCEEREAVGYPEMEAMAESLLKGVGHTLERMGACEDTGSPRTVLYATVEEWRNGSVADRYFEQHGWVNVDDRLTSPDGLYRANNMTSRDAEFSPTTFVTVQFFEVADDA